MERQSLFRIGLPSSRRDGGSCICPLLWSDLTVASYSVRTLATSSLGVSPALPSVAADGIFIAVDTELGFSQASAICLASGHWRLFTAHTIQRHLPFSAQRQHCVGPRVCTCPGTQLPGKALGGRRSLRMPLGTEVVAVAPVCPRTSLCSAPMLGALLLHQCAWGGCRITGNAIHSLAHSLRHTPLLTD